MVREILALGTLAVGLAAAAGSAKVQAVMSQGTALSGTASGQAYLLVQVNDPATGAPVTGLPQADFQVSDLMSLPAQVCGFSNQMESFVEAGNGAYEIKVGLPQNVPNCVWVKGVYLAGIQVTGTAAGQTIAGQAIATLTVR